jgi:hypothetical protein
VLQLILGEIQTPAPRAAVPGRGVAGAGVGRGDSRRGILAAIALASGLALAGSPLPRLLVAHRPQVSAALPSSVAGRGRIVAVQADVGAGEHAVPVTPHALDLAFVTSCPSDTGVVDIEVTVNGRRLGEVHDCTPHSLGASGPSSLESFWSSFGARAGRQLRVGVRARVRSLAPGVQRAVPSVVYLGVYEAVENALPAAPRPVTPPRGERAVAQVALDVDHARVPLLVLQRRSHALSFSGSCGGAAIGLGYTLLAAGRIIAQGDCGERPLVHPLNLSALPAAQIREGMLTVIVSLSRASGEPLVDHPPSGTARAVITLYGRRPAEPQR